MNYLKNFIIVDDDKLNNKLCRTIVEKTYPDALVVDFTDPVAGFNYIADKYSQADTDERAILLLDIMMPVMDAWAFLERFEQLDEVTRGRVKIYILSSSIDKADMARAQSNKHVEYYLIKPLTKESIKLIVHVLNKRLGLS
jgi:CheY-like chemotaxis protein